MLLFLYGSDTFRSRAHLKKIIEKFKKDRDPQGLNVARVDCLAKEAGPPAQSFGEAGKIWEQILATPFLAERRMAVLENLLVSKHQELMAELLVRIKDEKLPDSTVLVFWEGTDVFKTKAAKALFEALSKQKYSQRFDELKGIKLGAWISEEVQARGGSITSDAVRYLVENVGGDMWRLNALLDQLVAYTSVTSALSVLSHSDEGEKEGVDQDRRSTSPDPSLSKEGGQENKRLNSQQIQLAHVQLFLDEKADDNIFNLVDAIVAGQMKQVYQMIQEQYRQGKDAQYIFAMIVRQFRILLTLRDLFDREDKTQSSELAQRLGLHPFVVKKSLPLVRRYPLTELRRIYQQLLDLDLGIKTSRAAPETLLDVFVGRVSAQ